MLQNVKRQKARFAKPLKNLLDEAAGAGHVIYGDRRERQPGRIYEIIPDLVACGVTVENVEAICQALEKYRLPGVTRCF